MIAIGEEVDVAGRAVWLVSSQVKQHRALNDKSITVRRLVDTMQEPFERISAEYQLEIFLSVTRQIPQFLPYRGGDIFGSAPRHASASRYGRMTLVTRQTRAAFQISSRVASRIAMLSRSASIATSSPIVLRNLKQSATVLAAL